MMISQHACKPQRCYELLFEAGAAETINVKHLNYKHTALQLFIGNAEENQDAIIQMFLHYGADTSDFNEEELSALPL